MHQDSSSAFVSIRQQNYRLLWCKCLQSASNRPQKAPYAQECLARCSQAVCCHARRQAPVADERWAARESWLWVRGSTWRCWRSRGLLGTCLCLRGTSTYLRMNKLLLQMQVGMRVRTLWQPEALYFLRLLRILLSWVIIERLCSSEIIFVFCKLSPDKFISDDILVKSLWDFIFICHSDLSFLLLSYSILLSLKTCDIPSFIWVKLNFFDPHIFVKYNLRNTEENSISVEKSLIKNLQNISRIW